jgi:cell division protein ZapA
MGQVTVSINERLYNVACGDGEEAHLKELAAYLNSHVSNLAGEVGQVGDTRLLLMAGLVVADELSEARRKIKMLESELEKFNSARNVSAERIRQKEDSMADLLDATSRRIDELVRRVDAA